MRARWVICIAAGVLALVVAALLVISQKPAGSVELRPMEETNISGNAFRMMLVSNGTDQTLSFVLWGESTVDGVKWKRETLDHAAFLLAPHAAQLAPLLIPTNGKPRATLLCAPIGQSDFGYWKDRVTLLIGNNPSRAHKLHVELE